jgi:multidrug efflux pump subunit AcrA (membrane-fusion protein)
MAIPSDTRLGASVNGDLEERVKQLRLDDQLAAGKARGGGGSWLPWVLCGLLAVTWAGVGARWYRSAPAREADSPSAPPSGSAAPQSGAAAVAPGTLVTQLKGIVTPALQVNLSPRDVAAEITDIFFAEGKRVKQGDKLAKLLDHQYANQLKTQIAAVKSADAQYQRAIAAEVSARARVAKALASLQASRASVKDAIAQQKYAQKTYELSLRQSRAGTIAEQEHEQNEANKQSADAKKVVADANVVAAEKEVDAARADENTATASMAAAKADLEAAEARRIEAQRLVDNCWVIAPIDGTILTKAADKGALVSPMSFNVASGICSMADLSKLEVEIEVPERQITRLKPGQDALLQADADPNRPYRGVVDRVMPIADDTKNVVKVRIRTYLKRNEEPGAFLKPKMGVTTTVYERPFVLNPTTDFLWNDEPERKAAWEAEWKK